MLVITYIVGVAVPELTKSTIPPAQYITACKHCAGVRFPSRNLCRKNSRSYVYSPCNGWILIIAKRKLVPVP